VAGRRIVTAHDLDATVRWALDRHGHDECGMCDRMSRVRVCRDSEERVQKNRAVVILSVDRRRGARMERERPCVAGPVRVHGTGAMMVGRMIVGMCVNEWRGQGSTLKGQRQHDCDYLAHLRSLFADDGGQVKRAFRTPL
jgi:hypothetical protein